MDWNEYSLFLKNIKKYTPVEREEKIIQAMPFIKKAFCWDIVKEDFERVLSSGNKKTVLRAFLKEEERFSYVWDFLDIPYSLKWGVEIEVGNLQLDKIRYFFEHNLIIDLMDILGVPKNISKKILKNSVFEKKKQYSKWNFTKEAGFYESEASSPIFRNDLEDLNQISAICTILKALGGKSTNTTGVHINVGVDYFECNEEALRNLLTIWGECEELFFKMAAPEGELIRKTAERMAGPVSGNIQDFLEQDGSVTIKTKKDKEEFLMLIQGRNRDEDLGEENEKLKWTSVNFSHLGLTLKNPGRIEVRIFNSSLEPEIIFQDLLLVRKAIRGKS